MWDVEKSEQSINSVPTFKGVGKVYDPRTLDVSVYEKENNHVEEKIDTYNVGMYSNRPL